MKRIEGATIITQYCMEDACVTDFIKHLPENFIIKELFWTALHRRGWHKLLVTKGLKKVGVRLVRENQICDADGVFKDKSRSIMLRTIKEISLQFGINLTGFKIKKFCIDDNKHSAVFRRMRKEIKLPNDRRQKLRVLGLVSHKGDLNEIISRLNMKKVACQIKKEEKIFTLCSEVL